ncbi:MAG: response regulator [Epsilonproteobacteria bacterium]|nr:response regulator [Campylobacterota bacterium]
MVKKIMVVDDDPGVIFTVKHGLENLDKDYKITTVNSGRKCLELLESGEKPDLILLDIMMPDMSGWETYEKIREKISNKKLPIVFLTARTDRIAKNAGGFLAEDYIEKPFKVPELKERLDKILKK